MYRHILIATDGSDLAEHAVTAGLSVAKSVGAKATVIMVVELGLGAPQSVVLPSGTPPLMTPSTFQQVGQYYEQMRKQAGSVVNRAENAAKQAGVPCDTIQVDDVQPYQAIITTAADRGCDLIVMASHGRRGLSAVVLGSVTNKVLAHTKTPVLVVC
jgi:nucleotide-binding universal stress UspA family protein